MIIVGNEPFTLLCCACSVDVWTSNLEFTVDVAASRKRDVIGWESVQRLAARFNATRLRRKTFHIGNSNYTFTLSTGRNWCSISYLRDFSSPPNVLLIRFCDSGVLHEQMQESNTFRLILRVVIYVSLLVIVTVLLICWRRRNISSTLQSTDRLQIQAKLYTHSFGKAESQDALVKWQIAALHQLSSEVSLRDDLLWHLSWANWHCEILSRSRNLWVILVHGYLQYSSAKPCHAMPCHTL